MGEKFFWLTPVAVVIYDMSTTAGVLVVTGITIQGFGGSKSQRDRGGCGK
jgi:hypothetical protein